MGLIKWQGSKYQGKIYFKISLVIISNKILNQFQDRLVMKSQVFEKYKQEICGLEAVLNCKFQCDSILPFKLSSWVTLAYAYCHVPRSQEQWLGIPWQSSG